MFAIVAAVCFGLALLLSLIDETLGELVTPRTLELTGLLSLAIYFAYPVRRRRSRR